MRKVNGDSRELTRDRAPADFRASLTANVTVLSCSRTVLDDVFACEEAESRKENHMTFDSARKSEDHHSDSSMTSIAETVA